MKFWFGKIFLPIIFLLSAFFVFGKNGRQLFYEPSGKLLKYNTYVQGVVEKKGEWTQIHLQFIHNWQLSRSKESYYLLQEWGEKYQGSDFNFAEVGLPRPEERVEKFIDRLGRVNKVSRYPKGHRYYLNLLVFPEHPISVGKSWQYQEQLNFEILGQAVPADCRVIYQLEKILVYKENYRCAKILVNGVCKAGPPASPTLDYRFQGKVFFDLDTGQEIDFQLSYYWLKALPSSNFQEQAQLEVYSIFEK